MREKSYMLAIPADADALDDLAGIIKRVKMSPDFQVLFSDVEDGVLKLDIRYHEEKYRAEVYPMEFQLPQLYRCQHIFPDVDVDRLECASAGLAVEMVFGPDPLDSYHLQLKLCYALLPDILAVIDDSSEKILSGHWVALAAVSMVPPAPRYIFTAQAVAGEDGTVWLHTHGLNRCGLTELEILNSTKETYQEHYNVMETMAKRMLETEEPLEPGEPLYLARLSEDKVLVATLIPWKRALKYYGEEILGGQSDRQDGHNGNTSAIFVYPSRDDYENGNYAPLSIYDDILAQNPIYLFSLAETERMKALASERVAYLFRGLSNDENHALVKLGLTIDEEYRTEDNNKEHIWFELLGRDGNQLNVKLTQEPYYIKGLHEGDIGTYPLSDLTDWIIYTPDGSITPDDVYIMDLEAL